MKMLSKLFQEVGQYNKLVADNLGALLWNNFDACT